MRQPELKKIRGQKPVPRRDFHIMKMRKVLSLGSLLLFGFASRFGAQEKSPMKLMATTPLPGFTGDFDHFGLDLKGKRLFLAAEDHKTVEVFDLDGTRLKSISGFGQ